MPKIKVFTANLGFYETAVAARSQKMALAHWGVTRDLFHDRTAKETNDPKAVAAATRKVGMVVRRPMGSKGPFEERADAEQTLLKTFRAAPKKQVRKKTAANPKRPGSERASVKARKKRP
jgi:colicin import membrane protein